MKELRNIVVLYDSNFINGGGAQTAIFTANAMAERGYRVIYFSGLTSSRGSELSAKVEQVTTNQFDILTHPSRAKAMLQGIWNKKAADALRELLQRLNPQETIIHLHGLVKVLSPSVGKVLTESGFPIVFTLHDYFAVCPNGGLYNYRQNKICHLKPMSLQCICTNCDSRKYVHKAWRVARQAAQNNWGGIPSKFKNYITVSKFSERIFKPYLPADANIYCIGNPIDNPLPGHPRANVQRNRLLVIGRISAEKGLGLACEAARRTGIPLTVIGEGATRKAFEQQYPEVEFKGWMKMPDVYQEMLQSSALIFPALSYETQGLVVQEALSTGLPVIVSDECAASDFVDGKNGVTFKSNNLDDLVEKIKSLFSSMERLDEMSIYAHAKYWDNPFTPEQYIAEIQQTYLSILNSDT